MARKKKSAEGEDAGKKKGNLVPAIIIAIGLVLGGKMMGGGKAAPVAEASAVSTTTTTIPGPVIKLDPITLNMTDGHFLRVGLGFQMSAEGGGGHGEEKPDSTDPHGEFAKALDITIETLGGRSYQDLVSPEGREAAKKDLLHELEGAYHGEIEDLYFTEFVLQ